MMRSKKNISLLCLVVSTFLLASYTVIIKTSGTHPGSTGAPSDGTCAQTGCHFDAPVSVDQPSVTNLVYSSSDSTYFPGQTYTLTIKVKKNSLVKFGFECVALKNSDSLNVGQLNVTDPVRMQLVNHLNGSDTRYSITHQTNGTPALFVDSTEWTFTWTAPSTNVGKITFWYAVLCTNDNGLATGDEVFLSSFQIKPNPASSIMERTNENEFKAFYNNEKREISFKYKLVDKKNVRVFVCDEQGKEIISTEPKTQSEGRHKDKLTIGNDVRSGIYFVKILADESSYSEKIIIQ